MVGSSKMKSNVKSEGGGKSNKKKVEDEYLTSHTNIQQAFASVLGNHLNDLPGAQALQCCVAYNKPCGCIRRYILAGSEWKESNLPNYGYVHNGQTDENVVKELDRNSIGEVQLKRASDLLQLYHRAAELKKEKCYPVPCEDGKAGKELRGTIGLGNGRKRSKKYEEFVMSQRQLLRNEYFLCEKAAMKLLGYSINFLYKKLRTNPGKESRIVTTNNAERANKAPRNLLTLDQLREMADPQQASNQCCCRNCISWLVKQHFDRIVAWRQRLEGSGQRVAQQIVAEVLLVSTSLDGQNSFCQNLVHWVTGCSFKKIRRVRDHLKKDPKTLPEHGLKKYWKDKANKKIKPANKEHSLIMTKVEKPDQELQFSSLSSFSHDYRSQLRGQTCANNIQRTNTPNQIINANNSNNRFDNKGFSPTTTPNPQQTAPVVKMPIQQQQQQPSHVTIFRPNSNELQMNYPQPVQSVVFSSDNMNTSNTNVICDQQQQQQQQTIQYHTIVGGEQNIQQMYPVYQQTQQQQQHIYRQHPQPIEEVQQQQQAHTVAANQAFGQHHIQQSTPQQTQHTTIERYETLQTTTNNPPSYNEAHSNTKPEQQQQQQAVYYHSFDGNLIRNGPPSYYIAPATTGNKTSNANFIAPFLVAQYPTQQQQANQQQFAANSNNSERNNDEVTYMQPTQQDYNVSQFVLLSPAPLSNDGKNFTADLENLQQLGVPLTPIQMYPGYFSQPSSINEPKQNGGSTTVNNNSSWGTESRFIFPITQTDANGAIFNPSQITLNQQQALPQVTMKQEEQQQQITATNEQQTNEPNQTFVQNNFSHMTPVALMQPAQANSIFSNVGWIATQPVVHAAPQQPISDNVAVSNQSDLSKSQLAVLDAVTVDNRPKVNVAWGRTPTTSGGKVIMASINNTITSNPPTTASNVAVNQPLPVVQNGPFNNQSEESNKEEASSEPKAAAISQNRKSRSRLVGTIESPRLPIASTIPYNIVGFVKEGSESKSDGSEKRGGRIFNFSEAAIRKDEAGKDAAAEKQVKGRSNLISLSDDYVLPPSAVISEFKPLPPYINISSAVWYEESPTITTTAVSRVATSDKKNESDSTDNPTATQSSKTPPLQLPVTNRSSPSEVSISQSLNNPNSGLETLTQALNTPTQALNTPNDVLMTSPTETAKGSSVSLLSSNDVPRVDLMPAPKKRRLEASEDKQQKRQFHFHEYTSDDFRGRKRPTTSSPEKRHNKQSKKTDSNDSVFKSDTAKDSTTTSVPSSKPLPIIHLPTLSPPAVSETPSGSNVDLSQSLNTPVFLPSALLPRSGHLAPTAFVHCPTSQVGTTTSNGQISASTPQFFTFMTGPNFPTQMFLSNGKSPIKQVSDADGGLQTPSRISVVTPSAYMNQGNTSMPGGTTVFCFQKPLADLQQTLSKPQALPAPPAPTVVSEKSKDENKKQADDEKGGQKLPKLVVQASSPVTQESLDTKSTSEGSTETSTEESLASKKKSLHRMRSGGKTDLILPLSSFVNSNPSDSAFVIQSPLNTPSAIQVQTPLSIPTSSNKLFR